MNLEDLLSTLESPIVILAEDRRRMGKG